MPEIKNQFTGGKMNKDLDERLIPNGEYRDAMNIQVSTSEGSDVGTVQNILGNKIIYGTQFSSSAIWVGAIADEKNDKLYWFIKDNGAQEPYDGIFECNSNGIVNPVLIDKNRDVLKFTSNEIITGINIIDDMLFWTDNRHEPKKINITRSKSGTTDITTHTQFVNSETGVRVDIKEEHITVIKKGPKSPPTVQLLSDRTNDEGRIYTGVMRITSQPEWDQPYPDAQNPSITQTPGKAYIDYATGLPATGAPGLTSKIPLDFNDENTSSMGFPRSPHNWHYDFSQLSVGDYFDTYIETDINGESGFELDWSEGDTLLFEAFGGETYNQAPDIPLRNYSVKARISDRNSYVPDNIQLAIKDPNLGDFPDYVSGSDINGDADSPREFKITWEQGSSVNDLKIYSKYGFSGRISKISVYKLVNGIPDTSVDLCPNPEFKLQDSNGNNLPQWKNRSEYGCLEHPLGGVTSTNPNYTDPNQPGVFYPNVIIDPEKFPCYPGNYGFSLYPSGSHSQATTDTIEKGEKSGMWNIVHDNNGGHIQAGGAGRNDVQLDNHPNNYGGLITRDFNTTTETYPHIEFAWQRGGAQTVDDNLNGYYNWRYYANDLTITGSDGYPYKSYDILNQHGWCYLNLTENGPSPLVEGEEYQLVYTLDDTGNGNKIIRGDTFQEGYNRYGTQGQLILANHGITNPWQRDNYFIDQPKELVRNGDFTEPDANGDFPRYWGTAGGPLETFTYNYVEKHVDCGYNVDSNGDRIKFIGGTKLNTNIPLTIETDQVYRVSFEISNISRNEDGQAVAESDGIFAAIIGQPFEFPPSGGNNASWKTPVVNTPGVHEFEITTSLDNSYNALVESGDRAFLKSGSGDNGFVGRIHNFSVRRVEAPNANVTCEVLAIHNPPTAPEGGEIRFAVDLEKSKNKIFEFKFPRFAYRYQYGDNEYSTISPFSPVGFIPGEFVYHPKEGYNLGMTNRLTEAKIKDFMEGVPNGVIAVDILYKDDTSPNIYIVDTIKPTHVAISGAEESSWDLEEYTISTEQIYRAISSNQLLRPWDAVPLRALAQDVTGNRIVYGNYVQGFNLHHQDGESTKRYYPYFNLDILSSDNLEYKSEKSLKSLREYQLGIVFADKYGRETPIISNYSGTKAIEKINSETINQLQVGFGNNNFPENMKYFKFFIKETSNEYYNLAMDRWYDAEDGGAWLAFPSSDRNKVDIDTFLILKKATDSNQAILDETKYKILDIQDNAPSFIKQKKTLVSTKKHIASFADSDIFGEDLVDVPTVGNNEFKMNYKPFFDSSGSDLDKVKEGSLWIDFENSTGDVTKRYRISKITNDYSPLVAAGGEEVDLETAQYSVILTEGFDSDINLITDEPLTGFSATKVKDGTVVNVYEYIEENQAKFDGRFFAKINVDLDFFNTIIKSGTGSGKYRTVNSKKLYYLSPDNSDRHSSDLTGQDKGLYNSANGDFGRFAPFFRNYNKKASDLEYDNEGVGQYAFGPGSLDSDTDRPWLQELSYYTTTDFSRNNQDGNTSTAPNLKKADSHGWNSLQRGGVFNDKNEQTHGDVWFIDGGPYYGKSPIQNGDNLIWANETNRFINNDGGISTGIEITGDNAYFNIAVGGIYNQVVNATDDNAGLEISNFFDLRSGANNATYGESTQDLVEKISPGQKFKFREDPTGEIYSIQPNVENNRLVRWNTIQLSEDTDNDNYEFDYENSGSNPTTWSADNPENNTNVDNDYTVFATQLSPNFSRGWKPRVLNSSGQGVVSWNPTGGLGPIENGLKLGINHSNTSPGGDAPNRYVVVDSLVGTDKNTKLEHNITVGMILTSHSDGSLEYESVSTTGKEYLAIKEIENLGTGLGYKLHLTGYSKILVDNNVNSLSLTRHDIFTNIPRENQEMIFEQPTMNGYSQYSVNRINQQDPAGMGWTGPSFDETTGEQIDSGNPGIIAIGYNLDFLEEVSLDSDSQTIISENPAVWETEPKDSIDLDLYYEASGYYPLELTTNEEAKLLVPYGSKVESLSGRFIEEGTIITGSIATESKDLQITIQTPSDTSPEFTGVLVYPAFAGADYTAVGNKLKITKPNGEGIVVKIKSLGPISESNRTSSFIVGYLGQSYSTETNYILNWHNCYSFGNGVESNRIRDNFNLPFISNGVKVSTVLDRDYGEERRKYGLIYSGLYNSNSGVNNLNQFIAAEKITKDINPIYGSIQKLHSRDTDLVTLCEDKCLRILANKDAVFNADGNPQLTATNRVLGQVIPFSGEYGISKNPESFASESYRSYFTDKVRGVVMRLSRDGLTPISMHGMKDWFKDNLMLSSKLIGSYDDRKDEYNITLNNSTDGLPKTVSFKENIRGWQSFKSFIPEFGVSMASNYYTMKGGRLYKHHDESVDRNTFYNNFVNSSVDVILNTEPGTIKSFRTLNYEGSQAKIKKGESVILEFYNQPITSYNDQEYYNLVARDGWFVESIITDQDTGYITDFIEKEGKWFANMNKFIDINL